MPRPNPYPDVYVRDEDYFDPDDKTGWQVTLTSKQTGSPLDLSASDLFAPVEDNGEQVGLLLIVRDQDAVGIVKFVLEEELYDKLGTYSRWFLHEGTLFNSDLVQGRILKNR